jgi:hypothetical protein
MKEIITLLWNVVFCAAWDHRSVEQVVARSVVGQEK